MRTLALTVATLLVGRAGAKSLTMAMAQIKKNAGFDPKEPPQHKTDVKVGMYIEHLLDVSAAASALLPLAPTCTAGGLCSSERGALSGLAGRGICGGV